jgi:hypothetical protein
MNERSFFVPKNRGRTSFNHPTVRFASSKLLEAEWPEMQAFLEAHRG